MENCVTTTVSTATMSDSSDTQDSTSSESVSDESLCPESSKYFYATHPRITEFGEITFWVKDVLERRYQTELKHIKKLDKSLIVMEEVLKFYSRRAEVHLKHTFEMEKEWFSKQKEHAQLFNESLKKYIDDFNAQLDELDEDKEMYNEIMEKDRPLIEKHQALIDEAFKVAQIYYEKKRNYEHMRESGGRTEQELSELCLEVDMAFQHHQQTIQEEIDKRGNFQELTDAMKEVWMEIEAKYVSKMLPVLCDLFDDLGELDEFFDSEDNKSKEDIEYLEAIDPDEVIENLKNMTPPSDYEPGDFGSVSSLLFHIQEALGSDDSLIKSDSASSLNSRTSNQSMPIWSCDEEKESELTDRSEENAESSEEISTYQYTDCSDEVSSSGSTESSDLSSSSGDSENSEDSGVCGEIDTTEGSTQSGGHETFSEDITEISDDGFETIMSTTDRQDSCTIGEEQNSGAVDFNVLENILGDEIIQSDLFTLVSTLNSSRSSSPASSILDDNFTTPVMEFNPDDLTETDESKITNNSEATPRENQNSIVDLENMQQVSADPCVSPNNEKDLVIDISGDAHAESTISEMHDHDEHSLRDEDQDDKSSEVCPEDKISEIQEQKELSSRVKDPGKEVSEVCTGDNVMEMQKQENSSKEENRDENPREKQMSEDVNPDHSLENTNQKSADDEPVYYSDNSSSNILFF